LSPSRRRFREMKWPKILGVVLGLVAGILWLLFGFRHLASYTVLSEAFPVLVRTLAVGFAVVASSLLALRWSILGGVLLILEGLTPLVLLFLMDVGYPAFYLVVSGLTMISGILFLSFRASPAS
jgi:hypothetical protein